MSVCSFCSDSFPKGTGILFVKKDGSLYYFCSSKCRKNQLHLKREGRHHKWTTSASVFKGKTKILDTGAKAGKWRGKIS